MLLSGLDKKSFGSRDEQEVAGYADVMNIVFESYQEIPFAENYIRQLHKMLLQYSSKDIRHRGEYKKMTNTDSAGFSDLLTSCRTRLTNDLQYKVCALDNDRIGWKGISITTSLLFSKSYCIEKKLPVRVIK